MQTVNDTLKTLTEAGFEIAGDLAEVPVAGTVGSTIVNLFWPESSTDVWSEIQGNVAALLNQTLDQTIYNQLSLELSGPPGAENEGLVGVLSNYLEALESGSMTTILAHWVAAHDQFTETMGEYQQPGPFLALFVQVVNLRLALLRDGVLNGAAWGWQPAYIGQIHQELKEVIHDSAQWVQTTYTAGLPPAITGLGSSTWAANWQQQNTYVRAMVLTVWDFVFLWPYFDPDSGPAGSPLPKNQREIYSDLIGGLTNTPPGQPVDTGTQPELPVLPTPVLTINYLPSAEPQPTNYNSSAPISFAWTQALPQPALASITTWVAYSPSNTGSPWVYTLYSAQVARVGVTDPDPMTGAQPPIGVASSWSTVPITSARGGFAGGVYPYINWIQFVSNGDPASTSPVAGNLYGTNYVEIWSGPQPFVYTYPDHQVSNVLFTQVSQIESFPVPIAVIFGFRLSNSY
jgi:hypothetical protein